MKNICGGRPKDPVWGGFIEVIENGKKKAKCCGCEKTQSPKVLRMKAHKENCSKSKRSDVVAQVGSGNPIPVKCLKNPQTNYMQLKIIDKIVQKVNSIKEKLDINLVNYFITGNIPFRQVENPHFKQLISSLSKDYNLPSRKHLSTILVDKVFIRIDEIFRSQIKNKKVTLFQDGWTNVKNESIIANSILYDGKSYIIDLFAPGQVTKNAEFLANLAETSINKLSVLYKANVVGVCTDNAAVMNKMKVILKSSNQELITVGCSAHLLNLLAKDISNERVVEQATLVQKYFKYNHAASGHLSSIEGSYKPILPSTTRWSSVYLSLNNFLKNLKFYMASTQIDNLVTDTTMKAKILNSQLHNNIKTEVKKLKPIYEAITTLQGNKANLADVVDIVKKLEIQSLTWSARNRECLQKRKTQIVSPTHLTAYLFHPKYLGTGLSNEELDQIKEYLCDVDEEFTTEMVRFQARESPYPSHFFDDETLALEPITWWKALKNYNIHCSFVDHILALFTVSPTSASIERIFSQCSYIQNKTRNKLMNEKLKKLLFCYMVLNDNE